MKTLAALLVAAGVACAQQGAGSGEVPVVHVQGNVYMLVGGPLDGNITVQVGNDGVLVVDTGTAASAPKALEAIRKLSNKPITWIINTHVHPDHTGGNEIFAKAGSGGPGGRPRIVAHENVLNRMSAPAAKIPEVAWPNDEYATPFKDFGFNGEAVIVYHMPSAHTDGDSVVLFRRSDVVSTGDIFTPGEYPVIDLERGGGVQGEIDALNRILEITVPLKYQEGGTYVIPGHGRLCEEADVVEYRDMVTIIRDRIADLIKKGKTLEEVKAAKPTMDYDTEYPDTTFWTKDMFVEAIYKSLTQRK